MAKDPLSLDFGSDKPFYVYLYRDPRPRKRRQPIYVGKGTVANGRADEHWRTRSHNSDLAAILDEVRAVGLEPEIEIVGWFDEESPALKCERSFIAKLGRRISNEGPLCMIRARVARPRHRQAMHQCRRLYPIRWQ